MARLMEDLGKPRNLSSGGPQPFALRKEGAGQAISIGLPNSGKSQLMANLTGADARVAAYPFTTQLPLPGMMPFENVLVQLVDTPAINDQDMQTCLLSLLRNADLLVIAPDLSADATGQMVETTQELDRWGYLLLAEGELPDPAEHRVQKRVVLVGTKADEPGALDRFQALEGDTAGFGQIRRSAGRAGPHPRRWR